jgi:hypothetical protein
MGGGLLPGVPPSDTGPDVSPVTTPDQKELGKSRAQGEIEAGWAGHFWAVFWAGFLEGVKTLITVLVGVFDEVLAFFVQFVTAAQGTRTQGFYDLVAAILNDLLGLEVAGGDIAAAASKRGNIGGMQKAGADFLSVLTSEALGSNNPSEGSIGGLPGTAGKPLTPEQGIAAAQAFLGFILSFGVRQGNLETIATAMPENIRMFEGIRSYGELMAKNLGLGRLSRRVLQPIIQTLYATPLQQALNLQYRPHVLDAKQLAGAYLRGHITQDQYKQGLALQGFTEADMGLLVEDTLTRLNVPELFILHENGSLSDTDFQARIRALGFDANDFTLLIQSEQYKAVQGADRVYAGLLGDDLADGAITQAAYDEAVSTLRIPKLEADALTRNAVHRRTHRVKYLSLGFLKRAYLDATITLQEYTDHALALGYSQDDVDILELELLVEQKQAADRVKAKAAKIAAKAAPKATKTPPQATPPATGG